MLEVNILGYGQMGRQISSLFCLLGCDVMVWSRTTPDESSMLRQLKLISKLLDIPIRRSTIRAVSSIEALNEHAVTIEAVVEDIDIKKMLFSQCKGKFQNGYYTNTSSYSPVEIGEEVGGLHFFNPISLKLVEYCQPAVATSGSIDNLIILLKQQQFHIVDVHPNRGYLANSLLFREIANAFIMIEQYGYSPAAIEIIYTALYKNRSVFDIVDLVGVDTTYGILENLKVKDSSVYLPISLRSAIKRNILGKKNRTSIRKFLEETLDD